MKRLLLACSLIAAAGTSDAQSTKVGPVISRDYFFWYPARTFLTVTLSNLFVLSSARMRGILIV